MLTNRFHLRMAFGEPRKQGSEDERHREGRHREPDPASHLAGLGSHRLQRLQRLVHRGPSVFEKALPSVRGRDRPRRPCEQRGPETGLELPDGLAECGGGNAQFP